jgi:hypothetical protein
MNTRLAPFAAFILACSIPIAVEAGTVYQCRDSGGSPVWYASTAAGCPSGTTPIEYRVFDVCVIPTACAQGPTPPEAELVEYLCCAWVSGDLACEHTTLDSACDGYLATCFWGVTESDGTVTCYD